MSINNTLYRFYAADGRLLYVGQTADPGKRFAKHSVTHAWWRAVDKITLEHYTTPALVKEAERQAIERDRPYYNSHFNTVERGDERSFSEDDRLYKFPHRRDSLDD